MGIDEDALLGVTMSTEKGKTVFIRTILTLAVVCAGAKAALAQGNSQDLLEAAHTASESVYGSERAYERYLAPAGAANDYTTPADAQGGPEVHAAYAIRGAEAGLARSIEAISIGNSSAPGFANALLAAASFIPAPAPVIGGFLHGESAEPLIADSVAIYDLPAMATGLGVPASLVIEHASARLLSYTVGSLGDPLRLEVRFEYAANDVEPSRIVTLFSSADDPAARWALIDFPAPYYADDIQAARDAAESPLPEKGESRGAIEISAVVNTLPPINLGSTSCSAADAPRVNLGIFSIGADIAVGVSLNTNTTLNMTGEAFADYPLEDAPGEVDLSYAGNTGSSSIEYSLAYAATFCVSVAVPIVGTCNLSASLANGSVTLASGTQTFTPFLLSGDDDRPVCTGDTLEPFVVGVNPSISLCDLSFGITGGLSIDPNIDYCIEGESIVTAPVTVGKQINEEGASERIAASGPGVDLSATWNGLASLDGSVTVSPSIGITIPVLGDLNVPLPSFPFQLPNLDLEPFSAADEFRLGLPDVELEDETLDFQDTPIGGPTEIETEIANAGEANLEILAVTSDNAAFSVSSPSLPAMIEPNQSLVITVEFSPESLGEAQGTLMIETNDPDDQFLLVGVTGVGIESTGCSASGVSGQRPLRADLLMLGAAIMMLATLKQRRRGGIRA